MTREITIDWKGGTRRVEIQSPHDMKRFHHLATAPDEMRMNTDSLAWMNATIVLGSDLDKDTVESMTVVSGLQVLSEVLDHWGELNEGSDTVETTNTGLDGIELNDQGAVDLGDME